MINTIIKTAEAKNIVPKGSTKKALADKDSRRPTWKQLVSGLPNKFFNDQLKGRGSIFGKIADLFEKEQDTIANQIMQLTLKTDLKELQKFNFEFALVTGIGRYLKGGPVVENPDVVGVDTVTIKVAELLKKEKPKMKINRQSFTGNSAMLQLQLTIGRMPVLDISIRYKGSGTWTSQPSVTGFMTKEFKAYLKDA